MRSRILTLGVAAFAVLSAACAADGAVPPLPTDSVSASQDYRLGPGDKIKIFVYGLDPINNEYVIGDDGTINLPFVQSIKVTDRTVAEVQHEIEGKLTAQQILRNPVVNIQSLALRPFYIMGEVQKPGEYTLRPGTTVMSAVAMAGGFTYRASKSTVLLTRVINGRSVTTSATQNDIVMPGDRITVKERWF